MQILQVDVAILSKTLADYILGITVSFCLRYTEHVNNKVLTGIPTVVTIRLLLLTGSVPTVVIIRLLLLTGSIPTVVTLTTLSLFRLFSYLVIE